MSVDEYDKITAYHYKAYRPPLHTLILNKCLGKEPFKHGLDIGCGTGKSTIALKKICETVVGIEPNIAMLNNAIVTDGVRYEHFNGINLNFEPQKFDLVTLAGSWWYGKSQILLNEIHKVSSLGAQVVLYDFEVLFSPIYKTLQIRLPSTTNDYDHFIDFSNFDDNGFELISKNSEEIRLELTAEELVHLLCSEKKVLMLLKEKYGFSKTFGKVRDLLADNYDKYRIEVLTKTYYTKYLTK